MATTDITHRTVAVNGINMHVAEKGHGPVILFLHGFPELWYTWRHQIRGLAARGYRAVAPDLRGYGDTDAPESVESYTMFHIVGDLVALIEELGQERVFVVGHDWGAVVAWNLCLFRPDKVRALVNMSVAYKPRNEALKPVKALRMLYGDDYYVCRFQEPGEAETEFTRLGATLVLKKFPPGEAETEFARLGAKLVLKKFLTYRTPGPLFIPKEGWDSSDAQIALPPWLSEEDINYYASKFEKTGFTGALNYYRALNLNWELTAPWQGSRVTVPTKFIVGDLDLTYHFPMVQEYINGSGFKHDVPHLEEIVVMKGVGHFINEEKPREITNHIYKFFRNF